MNAQGKPAAKNSQARQIWRRLRKNKMAVAGLVILAILCFFAATADLFFDYEAQAVMQSAAFKLNPPSLEHLLGTDEMGRDILVRIIYGARISLPFAFITIVISATVGGLLGAVAGYVSRTGTT